MIGQFANAGLSGPGYAAMEAHVETCSACQDILKSKRSDLFSSSCKPLRGRKNFGPFPGALLSSSTDAAPFRLRLSSAAINSVIHGYGGTKVGFQTVFPTSVWKGPTHEHRNSSAHAPRPAIGRPRRRNADRVPPRRPAARCPLSQEAIRPRTGIIAFLDACAAPFFAVRIMGIASNGLRTGSEISSGFSLLNALGSQRWIITCTFFCGSTHESLKVGRAKMWLGAGLNFFRCVIVMARRQRSLTRVWRGLPPTRTRVL